MSKLIRTSTETSFRVLPWTDGGNSPRVEHQPSMLITILSQLIFTFQQYLVWYPLRVIQVNVRSSRLAKVCWHQERPSTGWGGSALVWDKGCDFPVPSARCVGRITSKKRIEGWALLVIVISHCPCQPFQGFTSNVVRCIGRVAFQHWLLCPFLQKTTCQSAWVLHWHSPLSPVQSRYPLVTCRRDIAVVPKVLCRREYPLRKERAKSSSSSSSTLFSMPSFYACMFHPANGTMSWIMHTIHLTSW